MNTEQNLQFFYLLENQMQTFPTEKSRRLANKVMSQSPPLFKDQAKKQTKKEQMFRRRVVPSCKICFCTEVTMNI